MIRKTRSLVLVFLTTTVVISLAVWFSHLRNQRTMPVVEDRSQAGGASAPPVNAVPVLESRPADPVRVAAGRAAYDRLRCASCHSVGGRGNTNLPLDGVAQRRDLQGLRDWTVGGGAARQAMAAGIARMKSNFAADPDLDALLDFLATLR